MGLFKDASDSFLKYSEKLVNKTEEYAKIAKLTVDIKKLESSIEKLNREIGEYVVSRYDQGSRDLSADDQVIKGNYDSIVDLRGKIAAKREEIAGIKKPKFD